MFMNRHCISHPTLLSREAMRVRRRRGLWWSRVCYTFQITRIWNPEISNFQIYHGQSQCIRVVTLALNVLICQGRVNTYVHLLREIPRHVSNFCKKSLAMGTTFPKNHPWRWVWGSRLGPHTPVTTKPEYPPPGILRSFFCASVQVCLFVCLFSPFGRIITITILFHSRQWEFVKMWNNIAAVHARN